VTDELRILVIEDSRVDAVIITELLKGCPATVTVSDSVPKCGSYHVILADLGLEKTDGVDTIDAVRRAFPVTPIVVMTSNLSTVLHKKCIESGASAVFVKGRSDRKTIIKAIREAVHVESEKLDTVCTLLSRAAELLEEVNASTP